MLDLPSMNNYFWAKYLRAMSTQTVHAWRRALPKMVVVLVAGWLCQSASVTLLGPFQEKYPWPSVFIFSCGLVAQLAGILLAIRFAGEAAGLWDALPPDASKIGREEPLLKVLSVSLLPFIGVYSVFGGIESATYAMTVQGVLESGSNFNAAATAVLTPTNSKDRWIMLGVLVGTYLLRRFFESLARRSGKNVYGVFASLVEGFFSVILIFGGAALIRRIVLWFDQRQLVSWVEQGFGWIGDALANIHVRIPEFLTAFWHFLTDQAWTTFVSGLVEPLLWLAAAGLVFGTYTLSLSELWDQGSESEAGVISPRLARLAAIEQRTLHASGRTRKTVNELVETFFSDLQNRVLPFIQALRHILRVGVSFLAAYVLLYALTVVIDEIVLRLPGWIGGGRPWYIYFGLRPVIDVLHLICSEPLRLALLAVAMKVTVSANREAAEDEYRAEKAAPGLVAAEIPAGEGRRTRRALPALAVALASVLVAGAALRWVDSSHPTHRIGVRVGEDGNLRGGQFLRLDEVAGGQQVVQGERNTEVPALRTAEMNVAVRLSARTEKRRDYIAMKCELRTKDARGRQSKVRPVADNGVSMPASGFEITDMQLIFERPADDLVGAKLACKPSGTFTYYEPELIFDLGIDEARVEQFKVSNQKIKLLRRNEQVLQ